MAKLLEFRVSNRNNITSIKAAGLSEASQDFSKFENAEAVLVRTQSEMRHTIEILETALALAHSGINLCPKTARQGYERELIRIGTRVAEARRLIEK